MWHQKYLSVFLLPVRDKINQQLLILIFSALLNYNWQIKLFEVYKVINWYMYILWKDSQNQVNQYVHHLTWLPFLFLWEHLRSILLAHRIISYSHHALHLIFWPHSPYNRKCVVPPHFPQLLVPDNYLLLSNDQVIKMLFLRERKEELKNIQQQKFLLYKCAMHVTKTKLPEPKKQRPDTEMQIHF